MARLKGTVCGAMLAAALVVSSGCVSSPGSARGTPTKIDLLVGGLSVSRTRNAAARAELIRIGEEAVPYLLREIDIGRLGSVGERRLARATRAIRVLREMNADEGVGACMDALSQDYLGPDCASRYAFLTEALGYLSENFRLRSARDSYVAFVKDRSHAYLDSRYLKEHWRGGHTVKLLRADVLCGMSPLARIGDSRVTEVMTHVVRLMRAPDFGGSLVCRLAQDGFTILNPYWAPSRATQESIRQERQKLMKKAGGT